ncbi:membrane protein [Dictyobacter alpinus]|uniref:Membrane protein n=1 Tax=Dictyobacter alpinus TaxID=2014873 RepID=A0A402BGJ1_9CHLR|nr:DoxX family protein [Dictyobacter alpinus]GCE30387.1 membrane protein [Dictyobacter alpinus]
MNSHYKPLYTIKAILRTVIGLAFVVASTFHFTAAETQLKIIPPFLPFRRAALYITGIFELLGGYGMLFPRYRRWASQGLAALLVAIVPANIYHAYMYFKHSKPSKERYYHYCRMPLQVVLILLTLWSTNQDVPSKS